MIKNRKQVISFTAESELIDFLNEISIERHTTVSQYIRYLLWTEYQNRLKTLKKEVQVDLNNPFQHLTKIYNKGERKDES